MVILQGDIDQQGLAIKHPRAGMSQPATSHTGPVESYFPATVAKAALSMLVESADLHMWWPPFDHPSIPNSEPSHILYSTLQLQGEAAQ